MARSRKKSPACGITRAASEKDDKVRAHKQERRAVKRAVQTDEAEAPASKAFGNPWAAAKDGRHWFGDTTSKLMRK
jgi:hypothetical protein